MKATEIARTQSRTRIIVRSRAKSGLTTNEKIDATTVAACYAATVVVGLWGFISFASAIIVAGGPIALFKGYFQALAGM